MNKYKHKIVIWNDSLNENIEGKPICQYWFRGMKKVLMYLKKGGDVIMSDFRYTYLDHSYTFTSLKLAYKFEPIPKKLEEKYGIIIPQYKICKFCLERYKVFPYIIDDLY